jgi:hypothetical protein
LNIFSINTGTGPATCKSHRDALQHACKTDYHDFFLGNPCSLLLRGSMFTAPISISCGIPEAKRNMRVVPCSGINPWLQADEQQSCGNIEEDIRTHFISQASCEEEDEKRCRENEEPEIES